MYSRSSFARWTAPSVRTRGALSRAGRRRLYASLASLAMLGAAAACGDDDDGAGGGDGEGDGVLTVWTLENLPDRLKVQQNIIDSFTEETGIEVKLVGIAEDQYSQALTSAAATEGGLPDVVGSLSLSGVRELDVNELLDRETAQAVVEELGTDTFSEQALALTSEDGEQLSVPSDGWAQLLVYRKDLFDAAGLEAPTTYDAITEAAETLDSEEVAGFVGANIPNDVFTEQTFEHVALGNDCEMVDDEGEVTLDSDECVEAFSFYGDLVQNYSVSGAQDVDTTRATYFAGEAAMIVWSSFILDEMAALRDDALPTCPECKDNPAYLAENSGVVTAVQGPDAEEPALFGEVVSWVSTIDAEKSDAQEFITYMMEGDAYTDWIGFAPEGKIPTRQGTADAPSEYIDAWAELPAGVDTKAPLSDFYTAEVLDTLRTSPDTIERWAITQGQGGLLGATLSELPVPAAVNAVTTGESDAEAAAQQADEEVTSIQESLQ